MKIRYTTMRILTVMVALIIFVIGYYVLLNIFFTKEVTTTVYDEEIEIEKIDTYVCYTTRTGVCYHSKHCQYISKSSKETTVYEAEHKGYAPCSRCTPRYPATIDIERVIMTPREQSEIKREYIPPAIIALTVSASYYIFVSYIIKKKYNNEFD